MLSTNYYPQNFSQFESLFKEFPKEGIVFNTRTKFEDKSPITEEYFSLLGGDFDEKFYPLYKINMNNNYKVFIIGRIGGYSESGERFIMLQLYDIKNKKFIPFSNLTSNSSDEGYSFSRSSFVADINGDGFFDFLEIYDSYKNSNKNKHNYSTRLYLWENNEFVRQKLN